MRYRWIAYSFDMPTVRFLGHDKMSVRGNLVVEMNGYARNCILHTLLRKPE